MSFIDPALLSGLSRIQGPAQAQGARPTRVPGHHFEQSLESLLQPQGKPPAKPSVRSEEALQTGGEVSFSKHAQHRMASRGLAVDEQQLARLSAALDELAGRGATESLVLMDDRAYVVGVPKRTVITVMSRDEAMGNVFTNIDSTFVAS
jgi:flagellar operon protein